MILVLMPVTNFAMNIISLIIGLSIFALKKQKKLMTVMQSPIRCIKGSGMHGVDKYEVHDATIKMLQTVVDAKKNKTTVGEIRTLIDELNSLRFNRKLINERLKSDNLEEI